MFGSGGRHNPSVARTAQKDSSKEKAIRRQQKQDKKRANKKRKNKNNEKDQQEQMLSQRNEQMKEVYQKKQEVKSVKKTSRKKRTRISTTNLLNETGPVNFDNVDNAIANDKANRLVLLILDTLVVKDRASAIATLKLVIGKIRSRITHTTSDPEADGAIVDTLVDVLESTLVLKGGMETDRVVTKKTLLAVVAKAGADNTSLTRRIEGRVGLTGRARALRTFRTAKSEFLTIYEMLKSNPKLAREKMVYREIRFNRVPRDLLREFWFKFLVRVESNKTTPRTCRWIDDNGVPHMATHVYQSIQYDIDDALVILKVSTMFGSSMFFFWFFWSKKKKINFFNF